MSIWEKPRLFQTCVKTKYQMDSKAVCEECERCYVASIVEIEHVNFKEYVAQNVMNYCCDCLNIAT